MKLRSTAFAGVLVACLALLATAACVGTSAPAMSTSAPPPTIVPTALVAPRELVEFVAEAAIEERLEEAAQGYRSPEESLVAYVVTTDRLSGPPSPIRVWRCLRGKLVDEELEAFTRAMGSSRSDWPPYTLYFAFEAITATRATVDLCTWYDMGISENSRGGFAQRLELERRAGDWVILSRDAYMHWD